MPLEQPEADAQVKCISLHPTYYMEALQISANSRFDMTLTHLLLPLYFRHYLYARHAGNHSLGTSCKIGRFLNTEIIFAEAYLS